MSAGRHFPSFLVTAGGRLRAVPILSGRFEFAMEMRRAFAEHEPTDVVVDLPGAMAGAMGRAVERLPCLSVIRLQEESSGEQSFFLVEPSDGLTEAVRLAREHALPLHCADRDAARVHIGSGPCPTPTP